MYGLNVHKAVINAKETETGITIHIVDDNYDKGKIIFQAKCRVDNNDTPESLANKVHLLEYEFYPKMIKKIVCNTDVIN
jgi:phosphoribosylglycinamide formyltransferase-1